MLLNITNLGDKPEAIASPVGVPYMQVLEPGVSLHVDEPRHDVLILGDKPDLRETFAEAAEAVAGAIKRILTSIFNRKRDAARANAGPEGVAFEIENLGASPIRAILGDGVTDQTIEVGACVSLTAPGYVELRELGLPDRTTDDPSGGVAP